jgi:putative ABC transport system permease protein
MRAALIHLLEGFRVAFHSLRTHRMRTLLTLLGNIVAMMSVISVVSILSGVDHYIKEEVAEEGSNTVTVSQFDVFALLADPEALSRARHNPRITLDDLDWLAAWPLPGPPLLDARASATADLAAGPERITGVSIQARTASYPFIEDVPLARGRHLTAIEVSRSRPVTVVGSAVAERLAQRTDPLGATVVVGGRHLTVVGILEEAPSGLGQGTNRRAIVPVAMFQKLFGAASLDLTARAPSVDLLPALVEEVRVAMRVRRGLRPGAEETFGVTTAANLVNLWERISSLLFGALFGIVAVSLVVGGVVVMNVMLVSVTERTREVGLRKSLGARRRDILWQFLFESAALSGVGGVMGIAVGFAIASLLAALTPLPYAIEVWSIVAGLVVTLGTGLGFGIYPALRAAALDPVEALGRE